MSEADDTTEKRKVITVTIDCITNKDNAYIKSQLRRGIYRALDTSGSYISHPQNVKDVDINVSDKKIGITPLS